MIRLRPELATAILDVAFGCPGASLTENVARALDPIILMARSVGKLDQANYMAEIQKNLESGYPHRKLSGFP